MSKLFNFTEPAQAVRFANAMTAFPGDRAISSATMVRNAIFDAGADPSPEQLATLDPALMAERAAIILLRIHHDLLRNESDALKATYSRNWDERREAAARLRFYFRRVLAPAITNEDAIDKLVTRHYIAERARGASWMLVDIANECRVDPDLLRHAADVIADHARQLEAAALLHLDTYINQTEEAHV